MHELHRAERLIKELRKRGVSRKVEVELEHIDRTMITLDEVQECFDILAKDTDLSGSLLRFKSKKVGLKCECGKVYDHPVMECESCGSTSLLMDMEDELTISSIEELP